MRAKPDFSIKEQNKNGFSRSCIQFLVFTVTGYYVISAILGVPSSSGGLDQTICLATLICLVIAVILEEQNKNKEKHRLHEVQQEWKGICKSEEVAIVGRQYSAGGSYFDDYGDYHSNRPFHHLNLETTADQKAVNPRLTVVTVNVYPDIYTKLKDRNTVRIYYKPESPMTFLLEEEL